MQRLGLLGCSFNPVHLGHLLVAQAAREELQLTRLFFIPAARSPFKPGQELAPASVRLKLLRLALAGQPGCEIDEQELARGGISYTVETVRDYARRFPGAELFSLAPTTPPCCRSGATRPSWRGWPNLLCSRVPASHRRSRRPPFGAVSCRAFPRPFRPRKSAIVSGPAFPWTC